MKKSFIFICILLVVLLVGCDERTETNEAVKYVKDILKIDNIEVSKCEESIDDNGYIDTIWTFIDKKNDVTFRVLKDMPQSPFAGNILKDDYDESFFLKLYDGINKKDNIICDYKVENGLNTVVLNCNFSNKKELNDCYQSLLSYKQDIEDKGANLSVNYSIKYDSPIRNLTIREVTDGDTIGILNKLNYNEMVLNYLSCALTYQIESGIAEINTSELKQIMDFEDTCVIFYTDNKGNKIQYDDIIANSHGISFGTLYKILEKEKFDVKGNPWHYTVVTKNNDKYEFSYDFNDEIYSDEDWDTDVKGYYYIKNGKKIKMKAYFYNSIEAEEINEMFGLNISEIENRFK